MSFILAVFMNKVNIVFSREKNNFVQIVLKASVEKYIMISDVFMGK